MKDTKFTVASHILVMLATSDKVLNSDSLAQSVGTNPSYIRKIMTLLKKGNLIYSQRGKSGIQLCIQPEQLSLWQLYQIVEGKEVNIFQVHENSNPECPVGRNIKQAVFPFLDDAEKQLQASLASDTLADVIIRLKSLELYK